jgi:hypothetical protein
MLKWKTPVPLIVQGEAERAFLIRQTAWLGEQEVAEDDLESTLAFGGPGVAERMFGFEGYEDSYSAPEDFEMLVGPVGAQKKIVMAVHIHIFGAPGNVIIFKKKGAIESSIADINTTSHNHEAVFGPMTLDSPDESMWFRAVSGTSPVSWSGSYVLVD